jgi:hypothetical protein
MGLVFHYMNSYDRYMAFNMLLFTISLNNK